MRYDWSSLVELKKQADSNLEEYWNGLMFFVGNAIENDAGSLLVIQEIIFRTPNTICCNVLLEGQYVQNINLQLRNFTRHCEKYFSGENIIVDL